MKAIPREELNEVMEILEDYIDQLEYFLEQEERLGNSSEIDIIIGETSGVSYAYKLLKNL